MHKHGDSSKSYESINTVVKQIDFNNINGAVGRVPFSKKAQNTPSSANYCNSNCSYSQSCGYPVTVIGFNPTYYKSTTDHFTRLGKYSDIKYEESTNYFTISYLNEGDAGKALKYDGIEFVDKEKIAVIGEYQSKARVEGHSNVSSVTISQDKLPKKTKSNIRILLECLCVW